MIAINNFKEIIINYDNLHIFVMQGHELLNAIKC